MVETVDLFASVGWDNRVPFKQEFASVGAARKQMNRHATYSVSKM